MERIKNNLNHIGLALVFLSLVGLRIWPHKKTIPLIMAVVGAAMIAAYIIFNISALKKSFKRKSFIYSGNLVLVIVLVLAILVLLNYFFARNHHRFDFTEAGLHSLSDQSVKVLKNLKEDIHVKCFFREGNFNRAKIENMMKIYAYHSKRIKYEFIDPDKNPGLVKRYDITQDETTIFESGDKENRITSADEEDITNALIKVSREMKKIIHFLEGHGEAGIEDRDENGYSTAKDELEKLGYEVKKITLALSETFPDDCALLVIPGPEKDLLPNELETIRGTIRKGGRVFFMVNPEEAPGLKTFLGEFGIQIEDDLIVDPVSRLLGGDYFMPVVSDYEYHEITRNFRYATFFPFARSVNPADDKPDGVTVQTLLKTSPNSWSERQLDQQQVTFDKDQDAPGPIPLAAVVTVKIEEAEKDEDETSENETGEESDVAWEGRLAVFGDADFASNRYYNLSGNGNLFLNTVNWLTEEVDLIAIQPKTSSPRTIQLTRSQGRMIFFASVVILPLIVLVTGLSVWFRRRSL